MYPIAWMNLPSYFFKSFKLLRKQLDLSIKNSPYFVIVIQVSFLKFYYQPFVFFVQVQVKFLELAHLQSK